MLLTSILIASGSKGTLSYDFVARQYFKGPNIGNASTFTPGLGYYVLLILLTQLLHIFDPMFDPLQFDTPLLVLLSVATGIVSGRLAFFILATTLSKKQSVHQRCEMGEIVESYHLINDGLHRFQKIMNISIFLITAIIVFAIACLALRFGIFFLLLFYIIVSIATVCLSIFHPLAYFRYFFERADMLSGHKLNTWIGKLIYQVYLWQSGHTI